MRNYFVERDDKWWAVKYTITLPHYSPVSHHVQLFDDRCIADMVRLALQQTYDAGREELFSELAQKQFDAEQLLMKEQ